MHQILFIILTFLQHSKYHYLFIKAKDFVLTDYIGIICCDTFPVVPSIFDANINNVLFHWNIFKVMLASSELPSITLFLYYIKTECSLAGTWNMGLLLCSHTLPLMSKSWLFLSSVKCTKTFYGLQICAYFFSSFSGCWVISNFVIFHWKKIVKHALPPGPNVIELFCP